MAKNKRTVKEYEALTKPGFYGDGGGLYLRILGESRLWVFRYKRQGKSHWLSLGSARTVSLKDARAKADQAAAMLSSGTDPVRARKEAKAEAARQAAVQTFDGVAALCIENEKSGWRNAKHAGQWAATINTYASPIIGQKRVDEITVEDVLECLRPIWLEKPETASRVRGRIERVFDFALGKGWRAEAKGNPAELTGRFKSQLPARGKVAEVVHHAALPWQEMPKIMTKLAESKGISALCLRFAILTAARSGEARGARWNEIDIDSKVWILPGSRMKAGREHRVPLSAPALAFLQTVAPLKRGEDSLVFPGGKPRKADKSAGLSDVAVSQALAAVAPGFTVHGCRSSFRDWAADATDYPREVAEAALAHGNADKVEAAYRRSDLFARRANLMADWAEFCLPSQKSDGTTTPQDIARVDSDTADSADKSVGGSTANLTRFPPLPVGG